MAIFGYARVSTAGQNMQSQADALRSAGCIEIVQEYGSGGQAGRPLLLKLLSRLSGGDTLIVVRIDRLARSLVQLTSILESLKKREVHFRSLGDPIDTSTPQGQFALHVLGAAAEFERAMIRERTMAGLESARANGRVGGNPLLRARDPEAIARLSATRRASFLDSLIATADEWLPIVQQMRPAKSWKHIVVELNRRQPASARKWNDQRLSRAVRGMIEAGQADASLLVPKLRKKPADRQAVIIAGMLKANPELSLRQLGGMLRDMKEASPRGGSKWTPGSVAHLIKRARKDGLLHRPR